MYFTLFTIILHDYNWLYIKYYAKNLKMTTVVEFVKLFISEFFASS
jgi:hypothetical protein